MESESEVGGEREALQRLIAKYGHEAASKKIQQIIWLDAATLAKVASAAVEMGVAVNVAITRIIREYFERPVKVVERVVVKEVPVEKVVEEAYLCPFCLRYYAGKGAFASHIEKNHPAMYPLIHPSLAELTHVEAVKAPTNTNTAADAGAGDVNTDTQR